MIFFSVSGDTVAGDTAAVYQIPEVVRSCYDMSATLERLPDLYERALPEVLQDLPFAPMGSGFGRVSAGMNKGRDPRYTRVYLNGHEVPVHPLGEVDLSLLPLPSMERVTLGQIAAGAGLTGLGLWSSVNRYERPFSRVHFTVGSFQSNTYGFDLTRALTNELGFYLSAAFDRTGGYRDNAAAERLALYSNVYLNHFRPMRFDVLYVDHDYGFPGPLARPQTGQERDQLLDVSGPVGFGRGALTLGYERQTMDYQDTVEDRTLAFSVDHFGLQAARHDTVFAVAFDYGARGSLTRLDGGQYLPTGCRRFDVWTRVTRHMGRITAAASGRVETASDHETFLCPRLELGLRLVDSVRLSAAVSRDARSPSDFERWAPQDSLVPYLTIAGNESLAPEYCWVDEFGLRGRWFDVELYRVRFTDRIVVAPDPEDYYTYVNMPESAVSGLEGHVRLPLRFRNSDSTVVTEFTLGLGGNIQLDGDTVPRWPVRSAGATLAFRRDTPRLGAGIALRAEHGSARTDHTGIEYGGYNVFTAAGRIRFLSLSCVVRLNNVFDEEYVFVPDYPMAPRNFDVSLHWEFRD